MEKVLIAPMTLAGIDGPYLRTLVAAGFEPVFPARPEQLLEDELLAILDGVSAALAGSEPYTPRVIAAHPQLKVIARAGVGYDAVDVPAATSQGIAVCITPNTNQGAVAEHTFAMMLAISRDLISQHLAVKRGEWPRRAQLPLRGKTIGIAGFGRIGKAVAVRARAFEMDVIAYDPYPDNAFAQQHQVRFVSMEELLAQSDYVSLHLPMMAHTRHLINSKTLSLMKPDAFLVNTARGGLVNEPDLLDALKNRRIAGAALDVFDQEPPGANPLFALDNVVLTPHAAGVDLRSRDDMALSAAQAIVDLHRGSWPAEKVVNPDVRDRFRW